LLRHREPGPGAGRGHRTGARHRGRGRWQLAQGRGGRAREGRAPRAAAQDRLQALSTMLRFGTSGIPLSSARPGTVHGIRRARELGLDHLEMGWVNGVRMGDAAADAIAAAAREHDVTLTAHAPYYVNLCGEADVVERSRARLEEAGR